MTLTKRHAFIFISIVAMLVLLGLHLLGLTNHLTGNGTSRESSSAAIHNASSLVWTTLSSNEDPSAYRHPLSYEPRSSASTAISASQQSNQRYPLSSGDTVYDSGYPIDHYQRHGAVPSTRGVPLLEAPQFPTVFPTAMTPSTLAPPPSLAPVIMSQARSLMDPFRSTSPDPASEPSTRRASASANQPSSQAVPQSSFNVQPYTAPLDIERNEMSPSRSSERRRPNELTPSSNLDSVRDSSAISNGGGINDNTTPAGFGNRFLRPPTNPPHQHQLNTGTQPYHPSQLVGQSMTNSKHQEQATDVNLLSPQHRANNQQFVQDSPSSYVPPLEPLGGGWNHHTPVGGSSLTTGTRGQQMQHTNAPLGRQYDYQVAGIHDDARRLSPPRTHHQSVPMAEVKLRPQPGPPSSNHRMGAHPPYRLLGTDHQSLQQQQQVATPSPIRSTIPSMNQNLTSNIPLCARALGASTHDPSTARMLAGDIHAPVLYCSEDPEYPNEAVVSALHLYGSQIIEQLMPTVANVGNRTGLNNFAAYENACKSRSAHVMPRRARSMSGHWKVIVNLAHSPFRHVPIQQTVRLEECTDRNPSSSGDPASTCNLTAPSSRCVQQYGEHRLVAWSIERGLHVDLFRLPVACACHVRR